MRLFNSQPLKVIPALAIVCILAGCSSGDPSYMPMVAGRKWSYMVRNAKQSTVETMEVVRVDSVAHQSGYLLRGAGSESRFAWKNGVLLAQELTNTWYSPPIPILNSQKRAHNLKWSGKITSPLFSLHANAVIETQKASLSEGGRNIETLMSKISISVPSSRQEVSLTSWFEPNIGLVRQEERVNGIQTSALELLSGP